MISRLQPSIDQGVEVDGTIVPTLEGGDGPSVWDVQLKANLTAAPSLAGGATGINLGSVRVERNVEEVSGGAECSSGRATSVGNSFNVNLVPWRMVWLWWVGWGWACQGDQGEDGKID